jgi:hypothetical protein
MPSVCAYYVTETKMVKSLKSKLVPVHAMKAYKGSRGIAPLIFNLGARRWVVNFEPHLVYALEGIVVPME